MSPIILAAIGAWLFIVGYILHRWKAPIDIINTFGDAGVICLFLAALWRIAS